MKKIGLREVHCLCLVCIGIGVVVDGGIAVGPRNQAVIVGQRMAMECRTDDNSPVFKWQMTKPNARQKDRITQTSAYGETRIYPNFQKFSYNVDAEGTATIFTNSTESKDAGIYFCYVNEGQLQTSAHLIVFESEPSCDFNHTSSDDNLTFALGDLISMRCSVNFSGLWTPSVEWTQRPANSSSSSSEDDGWGEVLTKGVTTDSSFNISISSELNVVVDFQQHTYFSFRVFFRWRNDTIRVNATNLPDFEYEWKSPEVIVIVPETEVEELPVVVQVIVPTVTSEVGSAGGDWYLMSVMLLTVLLVFVFAIIGLIARRCHAGYRRVNGMEQHSRPVNATVLRGLERPASGEYDVIVFASPNIYETINDNEAARATTCETTCQEQQQQQQQPMQQHRALVEPTYSRLSAATVEAPGAYDALSLYLAMESPSRAPQSHPLASIDYTQEKVDSEHLGTSASKSSGDTGAKSDYLTLVEEGEQPAMKGGSTGGDIDDYVQAEDDKVAAAAAAVAASVAKTNDDDDGDYLIACS